MVKQRRAYDEALDAMAGGSGALGRGGMVTKVTAARTAARSGANTVIACGRTDGVISGLATGQVDGTLLTADEENLVSRKQWLAGLPPRGRLRLDDGAVRVLLEDGRSLLPIGVTSVEGNFSRGDMVACVDRHGEEVARGLVNYSDGDARRIAGKSTSEAESELGILNDDELIHRDNLVVSQGLVLPS